MIDHHRHILAIETTINELMDVFAQARQERSVENLQDALGKLQDKTTAVTVATAAAVLDLLRENQLRSTDGNSGVISQ